MESRRLILEGGPRGAEWLLAWDDAMLAVSNPDGRRVLECPSATAHRLVDLSLLYTERKVGFASPRVSLTFKKQPDAVAALRGLVEAGLARDAEFRSEVRRSSLRSIPTGLAMFVVGGGLFGLYCWYASWAPDPPPGHWLRWFGGLIHWVLLVLMAVGLAGPCVAYRGLRQWLRVRHIERFAADAGK